MKKIIYIVLLSVLLAGFIACKKESITTNKPETITPFKKIPFELDSLEKELLFATDQTVIMFASTDTLNSQIKRIEKSPDQRLFMVGEEGSFYEVNYFQYGNNPVSYQGYVKKEFFEKKDPYSLDLVDLNEIRYSNLKGVYNDQDKSFSKYGTVKLISYDFYKKQKNKLSTNFITHANDISFNNEIGRAH